MAGFTVPYAPSQIYTPNGRLVDLIRLQGEDAARAAELRGQQQAQLWSGVGNAIQGGVQSIVQAQAQAPKIALEKQAVAKGQVEASDLQAMDKAFSAPGGRDAILANLPGHLRPQVAASFSAADKSAAELQEAQLKAEGATSDYVNTLAEQAKSHDYDPVAFQLAISHAKQTFASNPSLLNQIQGIESQIHDNPTTDAVKAIVDPILATHAAQEKPVILPATPRGGAPAQLVRPSGGPPVAVGQPSPDQPPTPASIAMDAAGGDAVKANQLLHPVPVTSNEWKDVLLDGKPAKVFVDPKTKAVTTIAGTVIDNPDARIKPVPPASMTVNSALVPSGDALDMAAKKYLATGELPSMGMGQAGAAARVAVMNAAAKIDPTASLAANKAAYKADAANLTKLQTTEGTLSAFEKTAGKNLDQFLSLADKIPDTGVPWLNQPIRSVNDKALGSADQAAFNAARDVALREIARVTNDPKLSGALTDSARAEVAGLSGKDATFAQIKAVAKVLKQDMANVHSGINEQINAVKTGLQGNPSLPAVTPTMRYNPATGKVEPVKSGGD